MDNKTLNIRNVCKKGENLQVIDKFPCLLASALDIEGKDRSSAVREIFLIERMIRMIRKGRMINLLYLRMIVQKIHNLSCVLRVSFETERKGFNSLKEKECVEGRDSRSRVTKKDRSYICYEGCGADSIIEGYSMIAGVRIRDIRILSACLIIEPSGLYDYSAESRPVSADKLCCGVNNDVRAMLDGTDKERCSEGIVHNEGDVMAMGDLR